MRRLIDADKLKKEIHCSYSDDLEILEKIENQPTAFDVEKVVADLEQLKLDGACECWDGDMGEEHAIDMAIEIVKRGGRDEEQRKVCERDC